MEAISYVALGGWCLSQSLAPSPHTRPMPDTSRVPSKVTGLWFVLLSMLTPYPNQMETIGMPTTSVCISLLGLWSTHTHIPLLHSQSCFVWCLCIHTIFRRESEGLDLSKRGARSYTWYKRQTQGWSSVSFLPPQTPCCSAPCHERRRSHPSPLRDYTSHLPRAVC